MDWIGQPLRAADPGATPRLEEVRWPGGLATRWGLGEAEVVWLAGEAPRDLHVVFGEDGDLATGLVAAGDAVLWLPPAPRRPELNDRLLRRVRRPPAHYALQLGWSALTAARMGRFGPVPTGSTVVHGGADPASAAWLALFDPRVQGIVDLPRYAIEVAGQLGALASCRNLESSSPPRHPAPLAPPAGATGPARTPEPAPWTVAQAPLEPLSADPPPPRGWIVFGEPPAGLQANIWLGGEGFEWDWDAHDTTAPPSQALVALGVEEAEVGYLGVGANGLHALRMARSNGGVAVAIAAPVTLWTPEAAVGPWPAWAAAPGIGVGEDPWWLLHLVDGRAVLVDPRDALGGAWTGPPPPAPVVASVAEALEVFAAKPGSPAVP